MEYLALVGTVTLIHMLAVIGPGPDFIMAIKNSMTYSRKTGIWTSIGFGLGIAVHVFYCLAGLALIISKSILVFNVIKFLGAGYLIYIGIKSLNSKTSRINVDKQKKKEDISAFSAVKIGFLTNVLNPKVNLFFLGLFTIIISPETPTYIVLTLGGIMILNTMIWFSLVSIFFTQNKVRTVFDKFQTIFNRIFGGLLIALGVRVATSD
ncbi:MAG: LysE family transporter [Candidatus Peregrinibacteria bacterium]|nr:LysE family transporter [Candidatus Peregrinibacteria bacterium]